MTDDPNIVMEKTLSKYRLPDEALDIDTWLRDGLAVYNLFILMKPAFFQMLEALGGTFESSEKKHNEDRLKHRVHFTPRRVEENGHIVDEIITITLEKRDEPAALNTEIKFNG